MSDIPIGEFRFECTHCGGTEISEANDATKGEIIVCNSCGQTLCTVAEFNAEIVRQGRAALPDIAADLRKGLSGIKGFKPR